MRLHLFNRAFGAACCLLVSLAAPALGSPAIPPPEQTSAPSLGLMGTIPIYWGEGESIGDLLSGNGEAHWARAQLEQAWHLQPLDRLDEQSLAGVRHLLLAQPRPLAPDENVALDAWVRGGGRLLLFADPMIAAESHFGIGDRRRPQDVILLSPLLRHWGLELMFDENQPEAPFLREFAGKSLPLHLPGYFTLMASGHGCRLQTSGIIADCSIGAGRAMIVADAAMLDLHDAHPESATALRTLAAEAFDLNN